MSWIWWIVGTVGLGGALLIGAVLIFGWPVIIGTKIGRMALAIGAGAVAIFGVFLKGRSAGAQAEKDKAAIRHAKNVKIADEEKKATEGRTDAEIRARLKGRRKP